MEVPIAAIAPIAILALLTDIYCWVDIAKSDHTKHLPKWAWAVIVLMSFPMGPIAYLLAGRQQSDT